MKRSCTSWLGWVLAAVAALAAPMTVLPVSSASATAYTSQEKGFDACKLPSTSDMATWWANTNYWNYYVYIGGSNKSACGGATLNSSWISTVTSQGWQLVFIWVGPQMPYSSCQTRKAYNTSISLDPSTAYSQGHNEGDAAYSQLVNLGIDPANAPVAYDLEGYNGGTTCRTAAKNFIKGWADDLDLAPAQLAGVYGSSCSSYLDDFASDGNPPDFIYGANWDNNLSTSTMKCVSSTNWASYQRHKQYAGDHLETYGGVTINIDSDCANGPVYGTKGDILDRMCA